MRTFKSLSTAVKSLAFILALALPVLAVSSADARIGGGLSSGSRGMRTFTAPPSTATAPGTASSFNRTLTPPSSPGFGASGARGGFFGRPGLMGGLMGGFLGAGLFGMLFGGGLFGGLGGLSSIFGLLLQIGLIVIIARFVMSWWQRRNTAAYAGASPYAGLATPPPTRASGFGFGSGSAPLQIGPEDYAAFERVLSEIQAAWSAEDVGALQRLATPEMVTYFSSDLAANQARGVVNKVSAVKLEQGDLSEAWREGDTDFATVALRYALVDTTLDRHSGRLVDGSEQPAEVTEVWTFRRERSGGWQLSAIQQV